MATGDKVYIADKETLDNINDKVGLSSDTSSDNPTTLFSGIKSIITSVKTLINSINTIANNIDIINQDVQSIKSSTSTPVIKKILSGLASSNLVNHEEVDLSKSIIILNASTSYESSPLGRSLSGVWVSNRTSTSFSINSYATNHTYSWQIIEFY